MSAKLKSHIFILNAYKFGMQYAKAFLQLYAFDSIKYVNISGKKEGAMKFRKFHFIPSIIAAFFLSLVMPSVVSAVTITFDWEDFRISTVTNSNYPLTSNPASAPALPADGTFTLAPSPPINPSSNNYFATNQGKFQRYNFFCPPVLAISLFRSGSQ